MNGVFTVTLVLMLGYHLLAQPSSSFEPGAKMARIPRATFEMGLDEKDAPRLMALYKVSRAGIFAEEMPKHKVTIGSYHIDKTEVTNADFKRFIERFPEWQKSKIAPAYHNGKYLQQWTGNDFPPGQDKYPVVFISWYAAAAFCEAQGKRLPTEAEWEFAARGGLEGKQFPWGDKMPDKTRANFSESGLKGATVVASYPANGYGLYDMAGNVWEYLADEWQRYPLVRVTNAAGLLKNRSFLAVRTRRALRGGSYGGAAINLRVTYRDSHLPENAGDHVGFRCAKSR
jgi:sulfatase modifying factor 1